MNADSVGLIDIFGDSHESRHRTERYTLEVHVQTCHNDADTAFSQLAAYIDDTHVEELRFVNTDYVDIIDHEEDVLTAVHRCRLDDVAVVADHIFLAIAHVDSGLVDFYSLLGKLSAFHTADELFGLTGEHRSAYYFDGSPAECRTFGVTF